MEPLMRRRLTDDGAAPPAPCRLTEYALMLAILQTCVDVLSHGASGGRAAERAQGPAVAPGHH